MKDATIPRRMGSTLMLVAYYAAIVFGSCDKFTSSEQGGLRDPWLGGGCLLMPIIALSLSSPAGRKLRHVAIGLLVYSVARMGGASINPLWGYSTRERYMPLWVPFWIGWLLLGYTWYRNKRRRLQPPATNE